MSITVTSNSAPAESKAEVKAADVSQVNANKSASGGEQSQSLDENTEESETSEQDQSESEDQESLETKQDDEAENESGKPPKKEENKGIRNRIKKFQKEISGRDQVISLKDQEIAHWKAEALKSKEAKESKETKVDTKAESNDGEPDPDNYGSHAEYIKAVSKWAVAQDKKESAQKDKENQVKSDHDTKMRGFFKKVDEFKKSTKDYDDVIAEIDKIPLNPAIEDAALDSDNGPEIMYQIAKNREEFDRINALAPISAARELGKFLAKMEIASESVKEKPIPKTLTKAPPPISPVSSKGNASVKKSLSDPNLTQSEYEAIRREQMKETRA